MVDDVGGAGGEERRCSYGTLPTSDHGFVDFLVADGGCDNTRLLSACRPPSVALRV